MLFRWILPLSVTLGLGILIGRLSMNHDPSSASDDSHGRTTSSPSGSATGDGFAKLNRSHERTETARKASDKRVLIELRDLKQLLSGRVAPNISFETIGDEIDPLLSMLGTTTNEREEIKMIFRNSKSAFLRAEKEKVRVKSTSDNQVTLDMSGMLKARAEIIEDTLSQIKKALDPERAAILAKSIHWDGLYSMPRKNEMKLSITRGEDALFILEDSGNAIRETRLDETKFPQNSQSVSASEAFTPSSTAGDIEDRWSHFLDGMTLKPSDPPDEKPAG